MSWTNTLEIPADGPDAVLVRVVRRLRLPYSRAHINRAILGHKQPNSLLALVEVAARLGLKTKAARTDGSALGELQLPMILHFGGEGSEGGFGVLEAVSPDGFEVWDSVNGLRVLGRDLFLSNWSGVVVLVERAEKRGPREKGYLPRRLFELVAGHMQAPALVGRRALPALRFALLFLVLGPLALSVTSRPPADRMEALALVSITILGLVVSVVTTLSVGDQKTPFSARVCGRGKLIDCESVLTSRYSRVFGIPLSEIGIGFFGSILLLVATAGVLPRSSVPWRAVGIIYATSLLFSALLIGVQILMRQFCTLCLAVHAVNASGAAMFFFRLRDEDASVAGVLSSFLLFSLFFSVIVLLVIPYVMNSARLDAMSGMYRRIMASPFASLAQILTQSPTEVTGSFCGVLLGGSPAEHELVVFAHPACSRCEAALRQVRTLVAENKVAAYLAIASKDPDGSDGRACAAILAVGLSLGPDAMLQAYEAAKTDLDRWKEGPIPLLAAELGVPPARIQEEFEHARRLVMRAEKLADAHTEGTPAIFFDSRPYRAPLAHLSFLLDKHPDLLRGTRADEDHSRREVEEAAPT